MTRNRLKTETPEPKNVKKQAKKSSPPKVSFFKNKKVHYVTGIFLLVFSVFLLFAFTSYMLTWQSDDSEITNKSLLKLLFDSSIVVKNSAGKMGAVVSKLFINDWFGVSSYLFAIILIVSGLRLLKVKILPLIRTIIYSIFGILWLSVTLGFIFTRDEYTIFGGVFGTVSNKFLTEAIGKPVTGLILFAALASFIIIVFNVTLKFRRRKTAGEDSVTVQDEKNVTSASEKEEEKEIPGNIELSVLQEFEEGKQNPEIAAQEKNSDTVISDNGVEFTIETPEEKEEELPVTGELPHQTIDTKYDPTFDLSSYQFPTLELLDNYTNDDIEVQDEELHRNKNRIVETLKNYAIDIVRISATVGPNVTLYEIVPGPGVRLAKIRSLDDDIALSLSAQGVRIIAPMPGKGTCGIEVPNSKTRIVAMKTILASEKFRNSKHELPIGLGKTIANDSFVIDLAKMPHLLIAGATGQGKSVGLNAVITSLIYSKHPSQVKFVLIDPKKVELSLYNKIERHFLAKLPDCNDAIITDVKQVVNTLNSLTIEMRQRLDLLQDAQVRNISEYNEKFINRKLNPNDGHHFLPYIVLIIDEFGDLIMSAGKEVEMPLLKLAQLARATGIHLVIATQRPSVTIITGNIKANFPARIAYRVISQIDSRTILDYKGAEQLIGKGDMLLSTGSDLIRLQCAFIDIHEVERITDFIGSQRAYPEAFQLPRYEDEESEKSKEFDPDEKDEFFEDAARLIVQNQHGSTSLIQRKLKLGYNRAGRIIDQLEAAGIVGPFEGSKAREVRFKDLDSLEQFLRSYNS